MDNDLKNGYDFRLDKDFYLPIILFYESIISGKSPACWTINCGGDICYAYYNKYHIEKIYSVTPDIIKEKTDIIKKDQLLKEINIELRKLKINKIKNYD